jgi:transposase
VSRYVARRRAELGLDHLEVSVPQEHPPGAEAQVDFGEFHAMIAGVLVKLWLVVLRLSCSGRALHVAFATQAQEAFLEGHVLAFEHFGGSPPPAE